MTNKILANCINGAWITPKDTKNVIPVLNPATGQQICNVPLNTSASDIQSTITAAKSAYHSSWKNLTMSSRASIMLKFHSLVLQNLPELTSIVVSENGKNVTEAKASILKGLETVAYAASLPAVSTGSHATVSTGITCHDVRVPLGVVACVVPFNFPAMVPLWTIPIALVTGNCVIIKPSEKVPCTMARLLELFIEAGIPSGVLSLLHGTKNTVEALINSPDISAVTFVGSSPVAKSVNDQCNALNKRVIALGGAKNHLIVSSADADVDSSAKDIVASFAGCAGQRCMAASVVIFVSENKGGETVILNRILEIASKLQPGTEAGNVGAIIDASSRDRIINLINEAEKKDGNTILLDGRSWATTQKCGTWVGPTIIRHSSKEDAMLSTEVFGPVLSILVVNSMEEAIEIENASEFGNAASIYTTNGGIAARATAAVKAGMVGVNIGVPVPREPFSFGGMYGTVSKYGAGMDITGDGGTEFFTVRRKITTRWPASNNRGKSSPRKKQKVDHASFAGQM